jgi:hypothetical protein
MDHTFVRHNIGAACALNGSCSSLREQIIALRKSNDTLTTDNDLTTERDKPRSSGRERKRMQQQLLHLEGVK